MNKDPAASAPPKSAQQISREEMGELPIRRYEGEICLVASPADLQRALHDIGRESVVGFDIETRPAFNRGESYLPSLVQFATADAVYLMQVQQQDYSGASTVIFAFKNVNKPGRSTAEHLPNLKNMFEFE